jgi:hypothetical protein
VRLRAEAIKAATSDEEADLRGLLFSGVARAEKADAELQSDATWARVRALLPLIAQAQSLLLASERARCRAVEQRRGRASHVRFACYDLSAVDPPKPSSPSSPAQDALLDVLAQLIRQQRQLLDVATSDALERALSALVHALRAEAAEAAAQQTARRTRAAGWCADAFDALRSNGARPAPRASTPPLA